jgi:hypothetical protein
MIGIITFNQDTFTNPTLYSIIKKLNEDHIPVTIFSSYQQSIIPSSLNLTQYFKAPVGLSLPRRPDKIGLYLKDFFGIINQIRKHKIKHILAVDPAGLVLAGRIKALYNKIQIHYCSFEIFFEDEIKNIPAIKKLKRKEIYYSKKVSSILIQDSVRQKLLQKENRIDPKFDCWHLVPVAPFAFSGQIEKFNKQYFGLTAQDKIYIHSGSVSDWSGIYLLLAALEKGLPSNTYVLIHNKNKFDFSNDVQARLLTLKNNGAQLILHDDLFESYEDYCTFLKCADYGLVLYQPDDGIFTGMNIKEIGLASGKFSSYMSVGLPCILFDCETYKQLTNSFPIGVIASESQDLSYHLNHNSLSKFKKDDCVSFFNEKLDPVKTIANFIKQLSN